LRTYRELLSDKYQVKLATALSGITDDLPVSLRTRSPFFAGTDGVNYRFQK
jgi:hypothetical protein